MRTDIFHGSSNTLPDFASLPDLFDEFGEISGSADKITIDLALSLGRATAEFAARIAVGYSDCSLCRLLAGAFVSGAAATGAQVTELGPSFFAAASYLSRSYLFNLMVFFENDKNCLSIRITDKFGLPIEKALQAGIETKIKQNDLNYVGMSDVIMPKSLSGALDAFSSSVIKRGKLSGFTVSVSGNSIASTTLREVLLACGCEICAPKTSICDLSISSDGTKLFLRDEKEHLHDDSHVSAACVLVHFLLGGKTLAVPSDSPSIFEQIALEHDGRIFRIGRDSAAREIYLSQEVLCNAIGDAVFLLSYLRDYDITAEKLFSSLPDFILFSREVGLKNDRKKLIKNLENSCKDMYSEHIGALRICADGGWVNIRPSRSGSSLRITGEGMNEEIASELCNLFIERATNMDNLHDK